MAGGAFEPTETTECSEAPTVESPLYRAGQAMTFAQEPIVPS